MSMEHIRRRYGVPAKRGARVIYTKPDGSKVEGRIQSYPLNDELYEDDLDPDAEQDDDEHQ